LSPAANVHIAGNALIEDWLILVEQSAAPAAVSGAGLVYVLGDNLYFKDSTESDTDLTEAVWNESSGNLYRSTGYVGIGSIAPAHRLDVAGNAAFSSPLLLSSGSASAPALTFSSESSTGIYLGSTGNIALSIAWTLEL
ncbi:MAG: hypothetical protein HQL31_14435, partial [Planctomycetes bacterium]|nr:hypothetical protein [Planctomycetota bacterium]